MTSAFREISDLEPPPSLSILAKGCRVTFESAELWVELESVPGELDASEQSAA